MKAERADLERQLHEARTQVERVWAALSHLVEAGEAVDGFLSKDGPPFKFNGRSQGVPVETALLSLHDYLNDARQVRCGPHPAAMSNPPCPKIEAELKRCQEALREVAATENAIIDTPNDGRFLKMDGLERAQEIARSALTQPQPTPSHPPTP